MGDTYRVLVGINYPPDDKRAEEGDTVDDLPDYAIEGLLSGGIIEPVTEAPKQDAPAPEATPEQPGAPAEEPGAEPTAEPPAAPETAPEPAPEEPATEPEPEPAPAPAAAPEAPADKAAE